MDALVPLMIPARLTAPSPTATTTLVPAQISALSTRALTLFGFDARDAVRNNHLFKSFRSPSGVTPTLYRLLALSNFAMCRLSEVK